MKITVLNDFSFLKVNNEVSIIITVRVHLHFLLEQNRTVQILRAVHYFDSVVF